MFCWKCGKEYSEDMNFCPYCGESKIKDQEKKAKDEIDKLMNYKYKKISGERKDLKNSAKEALKDGTWFMLFIICFLCQLALQITSSFFIGLVFSGLVSCSIFYVTKQVLITGKANFETIYKPYTKMKDFGSFLLKSFGASLLISLIVSLGLFLFIIPGIYFAICYSQTLFFLADNPELSISEAMDKSKNAINGHKWDYFVLQLSFIPTIFLIIFTLGIYSLYGTPYIQAVNTKYYFYLRGELNDNQNRIEYDYYN